MTVDGIPLVLFVLKVIATILVGISLFIWLVYCLNEGASDAHVHLCILAFHIIWITAVLWYYEMFGHYATIVLFFVGLLFAAVGVGMILMDAGCQNTMHEWFGMLTVILAFVTWLVGTTLTFTMDETTTNFLYMGLAMTTMFLASLTLISGMMMESGYSDWASAFLLILHVVIIAAYTLMSLSVVVYTLYVGGGGNSTVNEGPGVSPSASGSASGSN